MAFLRLILPALLAGLYAALFLALLVLLLNPGLPSRPLVFAGFVPMMLLLALGAGIGLPLAYRFLRLFARRPLRLRGLPFKVFYGFAAADLGLAAGIYWFNASLLAAMSPPESLFRVRAAGVLVALAGVWFAIAAAAPGIRRRPAVRLCCHLCLVALPAGVFLLRPAAAGAWVPSTAEAFRAPPGTPRILLVGIGGATLDQVLPLVAQGKLPWFSRLLRQGAHGRLSPFKPCVVPAVWQSLWTGKLPEKHGILGTDRYRLPGGGGEIRLAPRGFGFHRLSRAFGMSRTEQGPSESRALSLAQIMRGAGRAIREADGGAAAPARRLPDIRLDRFLDPEMAAPPGTGVLARQLRRSLRQDQTVAAAGLALWRGSPSQSVIVVLPGLDRVSHFFLRYSMPSGFGNVPAEEVEKYGAVLERYYRFLDDWLGLFLEEEDLAGEPQPGQAVVLVISPHGIEPPTLPRRLSGWLEGNRLERGVHARGPDGMILAEGPGIRHGLPLGKASVLDLVPTLLYLQKLPIAMDMDGHVLTRLFERAFTAENPILLIPSYEGPAETRVGF
jgi:type I phosphodiesterase/nucleotide pyrophosphatase